MVVVICNYISLLINFFRYQLAGVSLVYFLMGGKRETESVSVSASVCSGRINRSYL